MGNLLEKHEQQLSQSLQVEYQMQQHPYLLHRTTNQPCTLHKITTNSLPPHTRIQQLVEEYQRTKCHSIPKLQTYYKLQKNGYCSDEETYYLIFRGQNTYTLNQEFYQRSFYQAPFHQQQTLQILQTYLCGLREYNQRFQIQYETITLDCLIIDLTTKRIHLKLPWLNLLLNQQNRNDSTSIMHNYPSPQKLEALCSPKMQEFSVFLSNLFSIGIICLVLKRLDFADQIYLNKQIQYQQIAKRLSQFQDKKLRSGLELLLNPDPAIRKQIFSIWGIQNTQQHHLTPLLETKDTSKNHIPTLQPNKQEISHNSQQPFRNTQVKPIPVESVYIPNLQLENLNSTRTAPFNINSARSSSQTQRIHKITINNNPTASPSTGRHSQERPTIPISFNITPQTRTINRFQINPSVRLQPTIQMHQPNNYIPFRQNPTLENKLQALNPHNLSAPNLLPQHVVKFNRQPVSTNYVIPTVSFNKNEQNTRGVSPYNAKPIPIQQNSVFGNIKQSFTYYELPQQSHELINLQQPVRTDRVVQQIEIKQQPKKQLQLLNKLQPSDNTSKIPLQPTLRIERPTQKQAEFPMKFVVSHQLISHQTLQQNKELSPIKQVLSSTSVQDILIKKQENEVQTTLTPPRPPNSQQFSSTIVEVKDQDTPDHSARSQDPIEEQYVVEEYQTGSRYQGFKSGGMRNGRGRFYYQDGGYYEGQWKNNKMDGFGKLYYEGGKLAYEGQWSQDEFNGIGKVYNDCPVILEGSFDYTNFDFLEDYWEYYEGMLVKDTKEGRGLIKLSNGETFEGDFHEDKIQGFGKFHTLQGKTVEGIWRESKLIKVINLS